MRACKQVLLHVQKQNMHLQDHIIIITILYKVKTKQHWKTKSVRYFIVDNCEHVHV